MGVFTRFKDIISSNINATLDKAEDPKKMIRMMIQEMEETLVELKSGCAKSMAGRKNIVRELEGVDAEVEKWQARAELAVERARDDLAKEALHEKNNYQSKADALREEIVRMDAIIDQSRGDIRQLEEKLESAKEKQRLLVQRHARAGARIGAAQTMRKASGSDAVLRFEKFEQRIERLEAEAEVATPVRRADLEEEFALLERNETLEQELEALKNRKQATAESKESEDSNRR